MTKIEVLNRAGEILQDTAIINVSMSNAIYRGPKGDDYVLTDKDKADIAGMIEGGEANLENYYTKKEVDSAIDEAIKNIDIPDVDMTGYATENFVKEEINKIDIPDVSGYQTAEQVQTAITTEIEKIEIPDVSKFQTAEQVETAITTALNAIGVAEEGDY